MQSSKPRKGGTPKKNLMKTIPRAGEHKFTKRGIHEKAQNTCRARGEGEKEKDAE